MIYVLLAVFLGSYYLMMRLFWSRTNKGRRSRLASYLSQSGWQRQRWSISLYNGRHNLGFGYYLHRST